MLLHFLLLAQLIGTEIMTPHIGAHTVTIYVNLSPPSGVFTKRTGSNAHIQI